MKLKQPKVFKSFFNSFPDNRGFLTAIDIEKIQNKTGIKFNYQLISLSKTKFTFRGMHYQKMPKEQNKIVAVHSGKLTDYVVKLSEKSFSKVLKFELEAGDVIVIPKEYAHGFLSKTDNVVIQYFMDEKFSVRHYSGLNATRFLKEEFPKKKIVISQKDKQLTDLLIKD